MTPLVDKISEIMQKIEEIREIDEGTANILLHSLGIGMNLIHYQLQNPDQDLQGLDVSEQIKVFSSILGFDLTVLVTDILNRDYSGVPVSDKEVDEASLAFIVADEDVDDYEKFLEENKVKENLNFLKGEL